MKTEERKIIEGTLFILKVDRKYLLRFEIEGINKNYWIFPGGSYERNNSGARELGIECAVRETKEETGLTPLKPRLKARIFFDNFKRTFPGKTEIANFDYDALYFISGDYTGKFQEISPDKRKQNWFSYKEALNLPMHEGDKEILNALERIPYEKIIEGRIIHNQTKIESAIFTAI
jgi:8-oxo-dGTP pyrophosphatase MutT (NUDIX family)